MWYEIYYKLIPQTAVKVVLNFRVSKVFKTHQRLSSFFTRGQTDRQKTVKIITEFKKKKNYPSRTHYGRNRVHVPVKATYI